MAAEKKKPKAKRSNKKIIGGVLLVLLAVGAIFGYKYYTAYFSGNTKNVEDKTYLYIRTGSTYDDVLATLKEKDFLISVDQFDKVAMPYLKLQIKAVKMPDSLRLNVASFPKAVETKQLQCCV